MSDDREGRKKQPPPRFFGYVPKGKGEDYPRTGMTPEQGCLGCSASIAVLVVTFLIWAFIYWYNEPDFHPKPEPPPTRSRVIVPTQSPPPNRQKLSEPKP